MPRCRGTAIFLIIVFFSFLPQAHAAGICDASAYQGDEAAGANQECPDASSSYYYDAAQACGAQKKVNNQTLVNLYGKPCEKIQDNLLVKGICVAAKTCKGMQYQTPDGKWHDATSKPFGSLPSSGVLGGSQSTFGTPSSGSLSAPSGSTPQQTFGGNSILQEAFNPTPLAEQKTPLTNSSVPDSFIALEQSSGNTGSSPSTGSESNWFNPTPLLDQSVGLSGGTLPPIESTPVETTPVQGAPAAVPTGFTQSNLTTAENQQLVQEASTFSNASDCGWTCTIGNYTSAAWDKTASAFDYLTNNVFSSPAAAQPYNMESQDALRQASMLACKDQGCNGDFVAQALGGVCGQESQCNSQISHGGSQYQGLGQLGVSETINATENLDKLASSPNLSADERAQVGDVVNQINDSLAAGQDPNKDPTLGSWLLVGRNMTLQDMGGAHPLEMVSQATDDPVRAGMILEAGQIAPAIYANGNVTDPSSGISSNVAHALSANTLNVSTGESFDSVLNKMESSSAFGANVSRGAEWASAIPLPQPSPLASSADVDPALSSTYWDPGFNYETAGSVPSESVPLPPENPLALAGNTVPQSPTNVSWVDTAGSAPAGLSGGTPTAGDLYGSGYGEPTPLSPTMPYNDSMIPTPDTSIPTGEEVTASVQQQITADVQNQLPPTGVPSGADVTNSFAQASPSATDLAREYTAGLAAQEHAQEIASQFPTPDTYIPSGADVTAQFQSANATDLARQYSADLAAQEHTQEIASQFPTPDTSIPSGASITAQFQSANATDLAREYAGNLSNTGPDTSTGIQYSGGSPLPPSYLESQIPTPDTSVPSGEAVTADVAAQINADVQNQITPDTNVPSGADVTADFQSTNESPSLWQRFSSSVSDTWNSWFGSSAAPAPANPSDSAVVPQPAVPYSPPRLTTADLLGNPPSLSPVPVGQVEEKPLPPAVDIESQIPTPDTSIPSGESVTAQIHNEITAGIPTPDTSLAQEGPGSATDLAHQYAAQVAAQERAQENARIESEVPKPDTWVPSGEVVTADINAQARPPSTESPTELAREYAAGLANKGVDTETGITYSGGSPLSSPWSPDFTYETAGSQSGAGTVVKAPSTESPPPAPKSPWSPDFTYETAGSVANTGAPAKSTPSGAQSPSGPTPGGQPLPGRAPTGAPRPAAPQPLYAPRYPVRGWRPMPTYGYGYRGNPLVNPLAFAAGNLIGSLFTPQNNQSTPSTSGGAPVLQIGNAPAASSTATSGTLTVHIVANPSVVAEGSRAIVSWTTTNAIDCLIYTPGVAVFGSGANGSTTTSPIATTTVFAAKCAGLSDTVTASTTVRVQ